MPRLGFIIDSYYPNRTNKRKMPWLVKRENLHRIAYTEDMRGDKDNIPTLLFYGAPFVLLKDVCEPIYRMMDGKVRNLVIDWEHSCRWRNGKCYWRTMIRIYGLDEQFISLKEFIFLLIAKMKRICNCTVRHYRLETFVNL